MKILVADDHLEHRYLLEQMLAAAGHVVVGIADSHEAAIDLRTQPGHGTTFEVYFPVIPAPPEANDSLAAQMPRGHGEHILVVDDEPAFVSLTRRLLEQLGYRSTGFTEPEPAQAFFATHSHDIAAVVTDAGLSPGTGQELARALRRLRPGLPILLTNGGAASLDVTAALEHGFDGYLEKPFQLGALALALHQALASRPPKS